MLASSFSSVTSCNFLFHFSSVCATILPAFSVHLSSCSASASAIYRDKKLEATFISMPQHVTVDGQNKVTFYLTKIWYIKRGLNYLSSKITKLMFAELALRLSEELTEKRSFYGRKLTLNKSLDTKFSPSTQHHSFFTDQDLQKFYLNPFPSKGFPIDE